jgi:molybdopterin-synthase adenylyltransferase
VRQLPYAQVEIVPSTIEEAHTTGKVMLADYDLIVSALGNPTAELALNARVRELDDGPPLVFAWLEPLGIGGHALLTGSGRTPGCFACLYAPPDKAVAALHNRASFAAPGQPFHRSLVGCGNVYTPYGSLDAAQTAQIAARLALDVLTGRDQRSRLRSWKGDSQAFLAEGFQIAARYELTADQLASQETHYPSPRCPVCGATEQQT